jgi:hypothetical protein
MARVCSVRQDAGQGQSRLLGLLGLFARCRGARHDSDREGCRPQPRPAEPEPENGAQGEICSGTYTIEKYLWPEIGIDSTSLAIDMAK